MSKREKRTLRLRHVPADYIWHELESVLSDYGYKELSSSGSSHRNFYNEETGLKITALVRPHGTGSDNVVKKKYLRKILDHLGLKELH